jgi:hypothetical protein
MAHSIDDSNSGVEPGLARAGGGEPVAADDRGGDREAPDVELEQPGRQTSSRPLPDARELQHLVGRRPGDDVRRMVMAFALRAASRQRPPREARLPSAAWYSSSAFLRALKRSIWMRLWTFTSPSPVVSIAVKIASGSAP